MGVSADLRSVWEHSEHHHSAKFQQAAGLESRDGGRDQTEGSAGEALCCIRNEGNMYCPLTRDMMSPDLHLVPPDLHVVSPDLHMVSPDLHVVSSDLHVVSPDLYMASPDLHVLSQIQAIAEH